jgi:methyl-accepting chemotaxis protein
MLSNLRIGTRLLILFAIQCALLLGVAASGLVGVADSKARLNDVYEDSIVPLLHLNDTLDNTFEARTYLEEALAEGSQTDVEKHLRLAADATALADKAWQKYFATSMRPDEKALADASAAAQRTLTEARQQVVAALGSQGRAAALEVARKVDWSGRFNRWHVTMEKLVENQATDAKAAYDAVEVNSTRQKWLVLGMLLGGLGLAGVLFWLVARSITGPIAQATDAAGRIATGDLKADIAAHGKDEAADLMRAFGRMQANLREMVRQIDGGVSQLSTAAGELSVSAEQVSGSSNQQSDAAATVAAAVEQVTVSIAQLSDRAGETHEISSATDRASREGAQIVNRSAQEITSIAQSVDQAAAVVRALGEKSRKIASIVNVIKDIADQTNLLALNAAIEAARAGEQGRGFAVVADEVRKLSEKTAGSTQEIASMIDSILHGTQEAVTSMEEGVSRVQTGVDLARQAGDSMTLLQDNATRMLQAVSDMSNSLKEQSGAAQEIARQVERIAQMSEENGQAVKMTARSAHDLESLSQRLRQAADGFRM